MQLPREFKIVMTGNREELTHARPAEHEPNENHAPEAILAYPRREPRVRVVPGDPPRAGIVHEHPVYLLRGDLGRIGPPPPASNAGER